MTKKKVIISASQVINPYFVPRLQSPSTYWLPRPVLQIDSLLLTCWLNLQLLLNAFPTTIIQTLHSLVRNHSNYKRNNPSQWAKVAETERKLKRAREKEVNQSSFILNQAINGILKNSSSINQIFSSLREKKILTKTRLEDSFLYNWWVFGGVWRWWRWYASHHRERY